LKQGDLFPLYVIVLNWNLPKDTIECIQSIQASETTDLHIILVDNGSTDASVDLFREQFGNTITILANPVNIGFAAGMNIGIKHALIQGAQAVLLLNNDTTIDRTMIGQLISIADNHPRAGLVGPFIYFSDQRDRIWRVGDRDSRWLPFPIRLSNRLLKSSGSAEFRLDYITACAMFIRREVLELIGLLDERYFMYYEDADFCQRARRVGYEIWCAPKARMWHKVSRSSHKQKPIMRYRQSWGRVEFYHSYKHGIAWIFLVFYLLVRALLLTVLDILTGNWSLIHPLWLGVMDGFSRHSSRSSNYFE
jgi:GT2 family glycosyltransferase